MILKYLSLIALSLVCLLNNMFTNGHSIKDQEDLEDKIVYKSEHPLLPPPQSNELDSTSNKILIIKSRMTTNLIDELEFKRKPTVDMYDDTLVEFVEHPEDTLIAGKSPAILQCSAKNADRLAIECANKVREDAKKNVSMRISTLTLVLKRKDLETKNSFNSFGISKKMICKCVAYTKNNERILSNKAIIRNSYLEEDFQSEPMDEVAYTGDSVEMRCDPPRGEPTPTVYWLKNNKEIITNSDSSRYKLSNDFSLLILAATRDDSDNFVCVATNQYEKRISKPAKLTILESTKKYFWSDWSAWSECPSVQCGGQVSISKRNRVCQTVDKMSQNQNVSNILCDPGLPTEEKTCDLTPCPVDPQWSQWSQWSSCSSDCKQYKRRICNTIPDTCFGERQQSRVCDSFKCEPKTQQYEPKITAISNDNHHNNNQTSLLAEFKLDRLNLTVGLLSSALFLIALFGLLAFMYKHKSNRRKSRNKRSDLNLYYTCEKPSHVDDACSIFKFSKGICTAAAAAGSTASSTSSSSASGAANRMHHFNDNNNQKPRIFENMFDRNELINANEHIYERQLLIDQQQKGLYTTNVNMQPHLMSPNHYYLSRNPTQNLDFSKNSPFKPLNSTVTTTSTTTSSSSSSSNNLKHAQPISYVTKSSMLSASPSSNIYYEAPPNFQIDSPSIAYKSHAALTQQSNYMNLNSEQMLNTFHATKIPETEFEPELAYEVADALNIFSTDRMLASLHLPGHIDLADVCVGHVGSAGAKLSLNCGINLIVPEGALPADQNVTMYLAISRQENHKPKLNDKNTLLSEIVTIGPQHLSLCKPVILSMEHCVKNVNQDWSVTLYSAFNVAESGPEWREDQHITGENNKNLNMFLNATESHFLLMTDKLGRYALTGESKLNNKLSKASKYFRLITFCSSCITSNDFNLRIYCVDSLLAALQEVIMDEKKIGGTLLEISESFAVSYSNITESLSICIDEISPACLNCKYNVNHQEIPLNHIWNERNHLLHCSFTLEINDSLSEQFKCRIRAYQSNKSHSQFDFNVLMNINYNLRNLFYSKSNEKNSNEILAKRLVELDTSGSWLKSSKLIQSKPNQAKSYNKLEKNLKKKICTVLNETSSHEKNWRMLAQTLAINRNLHYFASKTSPTDMLLLYFEAISDLKSSELNNNNNNSKPEQTTPKSAAASSSATTNMICLSNENLFLRTFLNNFMDTLKINEDLVKLIYTEHE